MAIFQMETGSLSAFVAHGLGFGFRFSFRFVFLVFFGPRGIDGRVGGRLLLVFVSFLGEVLIAWFSISSFWS